jgi:hypothetical protein
MPAEHAGSSTGGPGSFRAFVNVREPSRQLEARAVSPPTWRISIGRRLPSAVALGQVCDRTDQIRPNARSTRKRSEWVGVACPRAMTPEVAASLRVMKHQFANAVAPIGQGLTAATPDAASATSLESAAPDRVGSAGLLWRESLHRRLLGVADVR